MNFESPALLALALLAALPVIAHMRRRAAARVVPFAAVEVALAAAPAAVRPRPPEDRALLALRVLVVLAGALAAAGPVCVRASPVARADGVALVLDDSASMRAPAGRPAFERARAALARALDRASPGAPVALALAGSPADVARDARGALASAAATAGGGDVVAAAQSALAAVRRAGSRRPALVVATDATRGSSSAPLSALARVAREHGASLSLPLGRGGLEGNAGVTSARYARDALGWGVDAALGCFGRTAARYRVRLAAGGRVLAEREIACRENATVPFRLALAAAPEDPFGEVNVDGRDAFPDDDRRPVVLRPPPTPRVLVVSPSPARGGGALAAALRAEGAGGADVREAPPVALAAALEATPADLLALVAVSSDDLAADARAALERYARAGGALLAVAPERGELPAPVRERAGVSVAAREVPAAAGELDVSHPATSALAPGARGLLPVTASRWAEIIPEGDAHVLWRDATGRAALLAVSERGGGRSAVLGIPLDESRATLALRPAWVALASSLARWLAEPASPRAEPAGAGTVRLRLRPGERVDRVEGPAGTLEVVVEAGGGATARGATEPGTYRAFVGGRADAARSFVVAVDAGESDLRALALPDGAEGDAGQGASRTPLRPWLAAAALVALAAEALWRRDRRAAPA